VVSGTLGTNVPEMVNLFVNGRTFESIKQSESVAHMTVAFGRVSMSTFLCPLYQCFETVGWVI